MELLKLSKFKLQLKALISEVKQLKDREISANDQVRVLTQKQKQRDEVFSKKLTALQAELSLSNDIRQKLEKKVSCLESENGLLESKQQELVETISSLLQSKQSFFQVYEDSFGEMKRAMEDRDKKIAVLSEKIKAHSLLFDTIEKEANSIKQVVSNAENALKEREEVVVGLKRKFDEASTWETLFLETINNLERKLRDDDELKRKDKIILDLEAQIEAAKSTYDFQPRVDELQNALAAKEIIIQNLILEKQALHFEVRNLGFTMKKIQDAVSGMDEENRKSFSSILYEAEECVTNESNEVKGLGDVQEEEDGCHQNTSAVGAVENSGFF
ncbi:CDK5 regulatory subunit-associated protein 2 [Coffea eugenioides]|uniref:CDK5 regulatory subunit-associated protein 2 n=1 Tax=Coffea eugenioides TaxID=49369 RepID=UPI000F608B95|nr:CDK5 regulatory subunit-associated protein 2 [Coffea eugenioides]